METVFGVFSSAFSGDLVGSSSKWFGHCGRLPQRGLVVEGLHPHGITDVQGWQLSSSAVDVISDIPTLFSLESCCSGTILTSVFQHRWETGYVGVRSSTKHTLCRATLKAFGWSVAQVEETDVGLG